MKIKLCSIFIILLSLHVAVARPDPAATFCVNHGGQTSERAQYIGIGLCKFPDGSECASWSYMRGKCKPGMFKDWIDENISKKPQLELVVKSAGYISNKTSPINIVNYNKNKALKYTDKANSNFYYMRILIKSVNRNDDSKQSHPAYVLMKKNGVTIRTFPVLPIPRAGLSDPIDLFIPVNNLGLYSFYLETTEGDEVLNAWNHQVFDNRIPYDHDKKIVAKKHKIVEKPVRLTPEQIRAMRLKEWFEAHPRK